MEKYNQNCVYIDKTRNVEIMKKKFGKSHIPKANKALFIWQWQIQLKKEQCKDS